MANINGKETPIWFKKGNIYQINPRTFSKEGTLESITREIEFLHNLKIKIIYLCPIFKEDTSETNWSKRQIASKTNNPKNPYRMNNYFEVDEEYGTMDDLKNLIKEAHKFDMKVILDLVYFHIGINAQVLKDYPDFVMRDHSGDVLLGDWNFPMWNFENIGLREYLWSNMVYYISAFNVDGFRCDVGDEVPLDFWIEGKRRIRTIKPDAIMINEGIKPEYLNKCFDAKYSFDWHETIYQVLSNNESAKKISEQHMEETASLLENGIVMRDIENHDTVTDWPKRVELVAGHDGTETVMVLNYIIDGIPMIYCGNELADTAKLSMFANRFYMGDFETTDRSIKNKDFSVRRQKIIKSLNILKSESDVLCYGETHWLNNSCEEKIVSFERVHKDEKIVYIGNLCNERTTVNIDEISFKKYEVLFQSEKPICFAKDNKIDMSGYSYIVIKL